MSASVAHRTTAAIKRLSPRQIIKRTSTTKTMRTLADKLGFVYFGYVDQQDDEHRLVRGLTASSTHSDQHYMVGTYSGYDVAFVVRRDTLHYHDKRVKDHFWTIATLDLHTPVELPHILIGNHGVRELLLAKYTMLPAYGFNTADPLLGNFTRHYNLYASLEHERIVRTIFDDQFLAQFVQHADGMSVELVENTLYIYTIEKHPSRVLLERMLTFGTWIAEAADQKAELLRRPVDD